MLCTFIGRFSFATHQNEHRCTYLADVGIIVGNRVLPLTVGGEVRRSAVEVVVSVAVVPDRVHRGVAGCTIGAPVVRVVVVVGVVARMVLVMHCTWVCVVAVGASRQMLRVVGATGVTVL